MKAVEPPTLQKIRDLEPYWKEFRFTLKLLRRNPLAAAGLTVLGLFAAAAILAPWVAPYGPEERIWAERQQPPSWRHPLGTDENGGDILSRIIWGARVDLGISLLVVGSAAALGSIMGAAAGFLGGKLDEALMRITDVFLAFPGLILAMAIAAVLGRSLTNLALALIIVWWPGYARLVRGVVLSEREKPYVEAAKAAGAGSFRIILKHLLPNSIYPLLVNATLDLGLVMLTAAGLSFIGFGAEAGVAEWGVMIADGRNYLFQAPWVVAFPGLAILLCSLALNLLGDGLRDALDPRLRG